MKSEDAISSMPDNVITDILDRLPLQDAVRTSILSRDWKLKWKMVTQLVFDEKFFDYVLGPNKTNRFDGKNLSGLIHNLKGPITKFVLYIHKILDVEDVNHCVLFLSKKEIKELSLTNRHTKKLELPTSLYSCMEVKHLVLHHCYFHPPPTFHGFPKLLSLDLFFVPFQSCTFGEFVTCYPLLEDLKIVDYLANDEVKLVEIAKHGSLKTLSLSLLVLDNMKITISSIFHLTCLPKLQELHLDFWEFKFLAEAAVGKKLPTSFLCLKTLTLDDLDFSDDVMVSFVYRMICSSPNLQTLMIDTRYNDDVRYPELCSSDLDVNRMGQLQLRIVKFTCFRGSEKEVCLMKSLLASSPLLENIIIHPAAFSVFGGHNGKLMFASRLLKHHQAYHIPEIYIR